MKRIYPRHQAHIAPTWSTPISTSSTLPPIDPIHHHSSFIRAHKQLPSSSTPTNPLPLLNHNRNLLPDILDDTVHPDIILIEPKWILQLTRYAVDTIECECDEHDDGDGPPCHLGDEREGEDHAEEGEDLFLVDSVRYLLIGCALCSGEGGVALQMRNRYTRQPNRFHPSIRIHQIVQLDLHLARLRGVKPSFIGPLLDIALHEKRQLQR